MKLNYKKTICVGLAFFLICAFWQAYDNTIPLILTNKFGMSQTLSGFIMAIDNILALFMLPLFGAISDKVHHKLGRRTPFILVGTIIAVCAFFSLSLVDSAQLKNISSVTAIDDPNALTIIYDLKKDDTLQTLEGDRFVLSSLYTREQYTQIKSTIVVDGKTKTNPLYTNYIVPARQSVIHDITNSNPSKLIIFISILLIALISMATFRSPAVALMPDVTIKPLRSKANAIINLMGTAGGMIILALGIVFKTSAVSNSFMSYKVFFGIVCLLMLAALIIFMLTVNEPKLVEEMKQESERYGIEEKEEAEAGKGKLSQDQMRSLLFILASIVLWFMGYNAVTTKYSVYATNILHKDYNMTLMIAQGAAIISYLPVGIVASKIGRKKTILAGIIMLAVSFGAAGFMKSDSPTLLMNMFFALAGIGWATINVNSFPMVVEMCSGADVGKYTGFYYTASMAAQVVTPVISGFLMDKLGMTVLFPYATIFVVAAFVTMQQVRHGDSRPEQKKDVLESLDVDA